MSTATKLWKSKISSQEMQERIASHLLPLPPAGSEGLHRAEVHPQTQPSMPCWSAHPGTRRPQSLSRPAPRWAVQPPSHSSDILPWKEQELLPWVSFHPHPRQDWDRDIYPAPHHTPAAEGKEDLKIRLCCVSARTGLGEWLLWDAGSCPAPCQELVVPWLELEPGTLLWTPSGGDRDHCGQLRSLTYKTQGIPAKRAF